MKRLVEERIERDSLSGLRGVVRGKQEQFDSSGIAREQ
jgi:hypothetical protein